MCSDDLVMSNRENLIDALSTLKPEWKSELDFLKRKAAEMASRPDVMWHMVVQSLSGMLNNRGYFNLIENQVNYSSICWSRIASLSDEELLPALVEALSIANVRMAQKKADWLYINYRIIQDMGGVDGARKRMGALRGYDGKFHFFQQFAGIGKKYGRNIWMDLYDIDFRNSIAIDTRIKQICPLIGIQTQDYLHTEAELLKIAREAGRDGWEMDRLLFHFYKEFKALLSNRTGARINMEHQEVLSAIQAYGFEEHQRSEARSRCAKKTRQTYSTKENRTMALSKSGKTIIKTKQLLQASGFTVQVLPGKRGIRGQGDFIVSSAHTKKFAKVRVKGHGDINNPCWFSLTFFDEDIQAAREKNVKYDETWRFNVAKYDFFILVSLPLKRAWLFTPHQITNLIEINLKRHNWAKERKTHKKVEMNLSVNIDGECLSRIEDYDDNLIHDSNDFVLLRDWLKE